MNSYAPFQRVTFLSIEQGPSTSFVAQVVNSGPGQFQMVIEGIDWTATQANPVHCFTQLIFDQNNGLFFWDSQSTGEGNGVRWSWRGSLVLEGGQGVSVKGQSDANITWGAVVWGYQTPKVS
jgi:hypothetical protein